MRICVMANALAVHTQRWARAYAERGHDVHVLSIRRAEIPGVTVHPVHVGPVNTRAVVWTFLSYLRLLLTARRHLDAIAPDLLNPHYTITHGVIAAFSGYHPIALQAWGKDVIWDGAGAMPWYLRLLNRYAHDRADTILSTSRFMRDMMRGFVARGREIRQVPFGVETDRFRPPSADDTAAATNGPFRIGFVKTLAPKYAPDDLLRAMPLVLERIPGARLVMAGRGPLAERLRQLADELGIAANVEFPGFVPHDQVPALMCGLDVLVNCSVMPSESFGVVIIEASACGLPVVATRVGGVHETCLDGETGFLVPPGDRQALADAIVRLARDPALRARFGRAGRRYVLDNYVWSDNVDAMLAALADTAAAARAAGPSRPAARYEGR